MKILFYFNHTSDKAMPCPYIRAYFLEFNITGLHPADNFEADRFEADNF
ncbi:hypothetical protein [Hugenholtzia roseola]|nr:hypothetical protein [Hugenholtzia roseola]